MSTGALHILTPTDAQSVKTDTTVVIPAKNEAHTIRRIVAECFHYARTVIVIDGHSTDETASIAKSEGADVYTDDGRGKGSALRQSIQYLQTPYVVFIDADCSHNPHDIPKLLTPLDANNADHVSASRLLGGSSELHGGFDEFFRLAGSAFITACVNYRFNTALSDSQNGFRAIRTSLLNELDLQENTTTIEQELIIKTLRHRARITEVASHEAKRLYGTSHINIWSAAPRYLYSLFKYLLM